MQDPNSSFRMHLDRLNQLIRDGGTLSGWERNCAFLNTRGGRFATVSAVTGLDFVDDARSPATVDWDGDGDLDLWIANRTAPRLRFLRNDTPSTARFVALRLRGTTCNRDAIGTRVELVLPEGKPHIKTLHAGEGFLSQSSKWLHFGLGNAVRIDKVIVRWPGGNTEAFSGIEVNGRYHLTQGAGVARPLRTTDRQVQLVTSKFSAPSVDERSRVVLSARLPVPTLRYRDDHGEHRELPLGEGQPVLVNLWASWCAPCLDELSQWARQSKQLDALGLRVVALTLDDLDQNTRFTSATATALLQSIGFPFEHGIATPELQVRLDQIRQWPFARNIVMQVPTSFLFDARGQLAIIYRGPVGVKQLSDDLVLLPVRQDHLLAAALPFEGRWRRRPRPAKPIQTAIQLMDRGDVVDAAEFVRRNHELLVAHQEYALLAVWLGDEFARVGRTADAVHFYEQAMRQDPTNVTVMNNLAWQLAANPDPRIRHPRQALQWAQKAVNATDGRNAGVLDTLAAAYAATGQFDRAVQIADQAMQLARSSGQKELIADIESHADLYRRGKPYHDPVVVK